MKKTIFFLFLAIVLSTNSCDWFEHCEGYYVYELENYRLDIIDYKLEKKYTDLQLYISADRNFLKETNTCSYMEDSFANYITKIDVFSETDYNDEFLAGENLNELFMGSKYENFYPVDTLPICSVVGISYNMPSLTLFLVKEPSISDTFIFYIDIEVNDGKIYSFETKPVIITL